MDEFDVTLEEVEAALAAIDQNPTENDPFWKEEARRMLTNALELLKQRARA